MTTLPSTNSANKQTILANISKNYKELSSLFAQLSEVSNEHEIESAVSISSDVTTTTAAPEPKKKKTERDPLLPKKPMNAYLFFCRDKRDSIHKVNPGIVEKEITKLLGESWRGLSEDERKTYDAQALKVKEEYNVALDAYKLKSGTQSVAVTSSSSSSPAPSTTFVTTELHMPVNIPSTTSDMSVSEADTSSQNNNLSSPLKSKKKKNKEEKKEKKHKKKHQHQQSQELSINA